MINKEKYEKEIRKLEEKYKNKINMEYFKERAKVLAQNLATQFSKEISMCVDALLDRDSVSADDIYDEFSNGYDLDREIQNKNITIIDLKYMIVELNKLTEINQQTDEYDGKGVRVYLDSYKVLIEQAIIGCAKLIEKLALPENYRYRELEGYCDCIVKKQGYFDTNDYEKTDVIGKDKTYYIDQLISFPSSIICSRDSVIIEIEQRRNITKLIKFSWEYYFFAFEYLRSYFSSYCKEFMDYVLYDYMLTFDEFTMLMIYCQTHGESYMYNQYYYEEMCLTPDMEFKYHKYNIENFFDVDNYRDTSEKQYIANRNMLRYF